MPAELVRRALNCLKLNLDALARHPQPMPNTHIVSFGGWGGHGVGANGTATQEEANNPPFWLQPREGGYTPAKFTKFMYYPLVTTVSPPLTEMMKPYPLFFVHLNRSCGVSSFRKTRTKYGKKKTPS